MRAILLSHLSPSMKEDDNKKPNNDDGRSKPKFENRRRVLGPSFFTNKGNKTTGRTCRLCNGSHDLKKCEEFKKKDIPSILGNTDRQMDCVSAVLSLDICQECVRRRKFVRFVRDYIQHPFTGIPKSKKTRKEEEAVTVTLITILDSYG